MHGRMKFTRIGFVIIGEYAHELACLLDASQAQVKRTLWRLRPVLVYVWFQSACVGIVARSVPNSHWS